MFDAVVARKARMDMVIDGLGKQPREDLVTSALFGTLRFLTPEGQEIALEALVGAKIPGPVEIHLWPYFRGNGENSEPDVVIKFGEDSYWIVEVKWGAGLGADQVGREIRTVRAGECRRGGLPEANRKVVGYTLLGALDKHMLAMDGARPEVAFGVTTFALRWLDVTERLRVLAKSNTDDLGLLAWSQLAAAFFGGEPEGKVLGDWPALQMPSPCSFAFSADE